MTYIYTTKEAGRKIHIAKNTVLKVIYLKYTKHNKQKTKNVSAHQIFDNKQPEALKRKYPHIIIYQKYS